MTAREFEQFVMELPPEKVDCLLDALKRNLDPESYRIVAMHISLVTMFSDVEKFKAMKMAVGTLVIKELYGTEYDWNKHPVKLP